VSGETVLVGGSVAQRPGSGGHTWVFLQYLLGLRRLGLEPVLIDWLEPEMCRDRAGAPSDVERSWNLAYLAGVMDRFGLAENWAVLHDGGRAVVGMSDAALDRAVDRAGLLLNVNGFVRQERVLERVALRAYLDIDPGFGQMWRQLGLHDPFAGHDAFVTVGEKIGDADCLIPTCGIDWVASPHPISLDQWPLVGRGEKFTSVGSWRGPYDPVEYEGRRFGLRAHELRKLIGLPSLVEAEIELALEIDSADAGDAQALRENGWGLADPAVVAADPATYRRYVQGSLGELMVAKGIYVEARSGWFSERSIAYLASGRPVVALDTGFSERYPSGEGLIAFDDLDGARAGIEDVCADWERHSRAAREIAVECFEAKKVLGRLLDEVAP
jgi:hypothetical protein